MLSISCSCSNRSLLLRPPMKLGQLHVGCWCNSRRLKKRFEVLYVHIGLVCFVRIVKELFPSGRFSPKEANIVRSH